MKNVFYFLVLVFMTSCIKKESPYKVKMDDAVNFVISKQDKETGVWPDYGWWNSANFLTAIIRYADVTGKKDEYKPFIDEMFVKAKAYRLKDRSTGNIILSFDNFVNDFYDDEGWWALAWIDAYRFVGDKRFLEMAEFIFKDMTTGWSNEHNGGIFWKKNPLEYKNSIANNLFSLTAIRLYQDTKKDEYLEWFEKNVEWYLQTGMYNTSNNLIEDGLEQKTGKPNSGGYFTYNQGVFIAVMTEMYNYTNDKTFLDIAESVAKSCIQNKPLSRDGILCEINTDIADNNDGVQFKGIFVRHLSFLYSVTQNEIYKDFILKNAESIINNAYDPQLKGFGCYWYGPSHRVNPASTVSALECLVEAYNFTK